MNSQFHLSTLTLCQRIYLSRTNGALTLSDLQLFGSTAQLSKINVSKNTSTSSIDLGSSKISLVSVVFISWPQERQTLKKMIDLWHPPCSYCLFLLWMHIVCSQSISICDWRLCGRCILVIHECY